MALGGGTFITQNKVLPGSYINFVSASSANATLSDRGIAALALELDWGKSDEVITVTSADFQKNSQKIFGYEYANEKLKGLRDLFMNIKTLYAYRLNSGVAATNVYGTAKCTGTRGNDIKIVIAKNVDDETKFDVTTLLEMNKVDFQTVATTADLKDNDYVLFKKDATLVETASTPMTGGTNASSITGDAYQKFLDKVESYSFNALGCLATETATQALFVAFTKRMRDEVGTKFQTVLYRNAKADYEGIVSVENKVLDGNESSAVYWSLGSIAGCAVNASNTNKKYDGEFTIDVDYTQSALEDALTSGKFIFHKVGDDVRVLEDINTFVSFTDKKGQDFGSNQSVRVMDQIANDIAVLFNTKYLGMIPNNESGRISLWNDIVKHHQSLETISAIEGFKPDSVIVSMGDTKKSVVVSDSVTITNAMEKLYMTVVVA